MLSWIKYGAVAFIALIGGHSLKSCTTDITNDKICNTQEEDKKVEDAIAAIKKKYQSQPGVKDISELNDKIKQCTSDLLDLQTKCDLISDQCNDKIKELEK